MSESWIKSLVELVRDALLPEVRDIKADVRELRAELAIRQDSAELSRSPLLRFRSHLASLMTRPSRPLAKSIFSLVALFREGG
jgi:hypothetical protein